MLLKSFPGCHATLLALDVVSSRIIAFHEKSFPNALSPPLRVGPASRRKLFWPKCVFLECGLDFCSDDEGGAEGKGSQKRPGPRKTCFFLSGRVCFFLRNHSIFMEKQSRGRFSSPLGSECVGAPIWLQKPWFSLRFLSPILKGEPSFPEETFRKVLVFLWFYSILGLIPKLCILLEYYVL